MLRPTIAAAMLAATAAAGSHQQPTGSYCGASDDGLVAPIHLRPSASASTEKSVNFDVSVTVLGKTYSCSDEVC